MKRRSFLRALAALTGGGLVGGCLGKGRGEKPTEADSTTSVDLSEGGDETVLSLWRVEGDGTPRLEHMVWAEAGGDPLEDLRAAIRECTLRCDVTNIFSQQQFEALRKRM
jgi:hypothetical protein